MCTLAHHPGLGFPPCRSSILLLHGVPTVVQESPTNPFAFTGREWNATVGLQLNRARYYSPSSGRFVSEDPIGEGGGLNLYRYANNSPTDVRGPWGLDPKEPREHGHIDRASTPSIQFVLEGTDCGAYFEVQVSLIIFQVSAYHDSCGLHFGGGFGLGTPGAALNYNPGSISCSSVAGSAYILPPNPFVGLGGSVGVGSTGGEVSPFAEIGVGTPGFGVFESDVWNCPNG
jgi:RHS repeat-associated protein